MEFCNDLRLLQDIEYIQLVLKMKNFGVFKYGIIFAILFSVMQIGTAYATSFSWIAPNGIVSFVPITIQTSTAISGNFQQMVYFNPSQYSSIASNLQNVEFFYVNSIAQAQVIPSWLESYSTSNAVHLEKPLQYLLD